MCISYHSSMSAEFFMTSYFRHAQVGGIQGGIQPECNQYQDSPNLLFFFLKCSNLPKGSSAVAAKSSSPFVLVSTWRDKKTKGQ